MQNLSHQAAMGDDISKVRFHGLKEFAATAFCLWWAVFLNSLRARWLVPWQRFIAYRFYFCDPAAWVTAAVFMMRCFVSFVAKGYRQKYNSKIPTAMAPISWHFHTKRKTARNARFWNAFHAVFVLQDYRFSFAADLHGTMIHASSSVGARLAADFIPVWNTDAGSSSHTADLNHLAQRHIGLIGALIPSLFCLIAACHPSFWKFLSSYRLSSRVWLPEPFYITHLMTGHEEKKLIQNRHGLQESAKFFRCFFQPEREGKCQHDDIADLRNHIAVHQRASRRISLHSL